VTAFLHLRSGNSGPAFVGQNDGDTVLWSVAQQRWYVGAGGGGGAVSSVFGRTGAVTAQAGDYDSDEVNNASAMVPGGSVTDALDDLQTQIDALGPGGVSSVFARTGAVTAQAGDYSIAQITGGWQVVADLAARNAIPVGLREVGQTVYEVDTDQMWRLIGGTGNGNWVDVTVDVVTNARAGLAPAVGAADTLLQSDGLTASWVAPLLWSAGFVAPTITQTATGAATGQPLRVAAQDAATTGGAFETASGAGGTTAGEWRALAGATKFASFALSNANDFLAFGLAPALTGSVRLPSAASIKSRNNAGLADLSVYVSDASDKQFFGSQSSGRTNIDAGDSGGVGLRTGAGTDRLTINSAGVNLTVPQMLIGAATAATGFLQFIQNINSGSNATAFLRLRSGGTTSGNTNGTDLQLEGGRLSGTGLSGGVVAKLNQDDTQANMWPMFAIKHFGANRRVTAVCFPGVAGAGITGAAVPDGDLMLVLGATANPPTLGTVGCGAFYVTAAGVLHYRGPTTDTVVAPA
jgi:hypothetical protein